MTYTKEQKILNEFKQFGKYYQGGELYFPICYANNFLAKTREIDLAIIGIEGYIYHKDVDKLEPRVAWIVDNSKIPAQNWSEYVTICYTKVGEFLLSLPTTEDIWVNFALQEEAKWHK